MPTYFLHNIPDRQGGPPLFLRRDSARASRRKRVKNVEHAVQKACSEPNAAYCACLCQTPHLRSEPTSEYQNPAPVALTTVGKYCSESARFLPRRGHVRDLHFTTYPQPVTTKKQAALTGWKLLTLIATVAIAVIAIVALVGACMLDRYAVRVGALATWVGGAATFAAASIALYQAHHARVDADHARASAELAGSIAQWESDRQRRIDLEVQRRRDGMRYCTEILDEIVGASCEFADTLRRAAFRFKDSSFRVDAALTLNLHWVKARPRIGARALPIADSSFAHALAETALPSMDNLFEQTSIISDASSAEELVDFIPTIDAALTECGDDLRDRALDDFHLSMDAVTQAIESSLPPRPE